ncbi:RNA polymerase subunit sigma [Clostridium perfringens]|uniref:RNA polymerase subunit sigma n=1 Tax=Clostridium perfringens TaxID=1502 RepID=UPI003D341689
MEARVELTNYEDVENYLKNYTKLKVEIQNLELDIEEIKNSIEGVKAVGYEERTGATNKFNSSVENEIINKERKIEFLTRIKRSKQNQYQKITNILSILKEDEYKIIELRYFKELSFKEMSVRLNSNDVYLINKRKKIINEKLIPMFVNYRL